MPIICHGLNIGTAVASLYMVRCHGKCMPHHFSDNINLVIPINHWLDNVITERLHSKQLCMSMMLLVILLNCLQLYQILFYWHQSKNEKMQWLIYLTSNIMQRQSAVEVKCNFVCGKTLFQACLLTPILIELYEHIFKFKFKFINLYSALFNGPAIFRGALQKQ